MSPAIVDHRAGRQRRTAWRQPRRRSAPTSTRWSSRRRRSDRACCSSACSCHPITAPRICAISSAIYAEVAKARRAALVPFLFEGFGDAIEMFQPDRIHPLAAAQPKLLDKVWPELSRCWRAAWEGAVSRPHPGVPRVERRADSPPIPIASTCAVPPNSPRITFRRRESSGPRRCRAGANRHDVCGVALRRPRLGAALVARNIAAMLEGRFRRQPREWRPLVYCWRGGQRSRSLAHVLNEVGWRAVQLEGGYRAYRRQVVADLARLPQRFRFVVICGLTGSGKSRLLGRARARRRADARPRSASPVTAGRCWATCPGTPNRRKNGSRASSAQRSNGSTRRARYSSNPRASASAACRCPMHCSRRCAGPGTSARHAARAARRAAQGRVCALPRRPRAARRRPATLSRAPRQADHCALAGDGDCRRLGRARRRAARGALRSHVCTFARAQFSDSARWARSRGAHGIMRRRLRHSPPRCEPCSILRRRRYRDHDLRLSDSQRLRRGAPRRQPARRLRGRARPRRRDHASAGAAVQPFGDDVHSALDQGHGAGAHLHADLRDAVRRSPDAGHRACRPRLARRRCADAGDGGGDRCGACRWRRMDAAGEGATDPAGLGDARGPCRDARSAMPPTSAASRFGSTPAASSW